MIGTLTHRPKEHLKPMLFWRLEGRWIAVYWDSGMTKQQTSYLIGDAGRIEDETYYEVGLTFDLRSIIGLTEQAINAWGFATAVPISGKH